MRGNAFLAVRGTDPNDPTPSVRVVGDYYAPTDPGSAPSGFTSTVYNYSPSTQAMLPEQSVTLPRGPDEPRQMLSSEGWTVVFPIDFAP
jgi:hypothetical protein